MKKSFLLFLLLIVSFLSFSQIKSQKRGIAFGHHSEADLAAASKGLSWWYNWYISPDKEVKDVYEKYDMDFVPMTWNGGFNETALREFLSTHPKVKYLLGFNEPNFKDQANMSPSEVAAQWPRLEAIARDFNLELVGPAVNYCGNCVSENGVTYYDPYKYLDDFFAACPDCKVDYIAVHNYMCYSGALVDYMEKFKKYNRKIWLTEFACWDQNNITLDMQKGLVIGALDYLENDTMVYRYSWFTGGRDNKFPYIDLFEAEPGKLTPLGELYVNYNASHDTTQYVTVPARIEGENYSKMFGIALEATSDFDGEANVGYISPNDWLEYNIDVPSDGEYFVYLRIASTAITSLHLMVEGLSTTTIEIPNTKGWQNWKTLVAKISLTKGKHKIRLHAIKGDFNLNWISVSDRENKPPVAKAGQDQSIELPVDSVYLTGTATDENGDQLKYQWTKTAGPTAFTIKNVSGASILLSGLKAGIYTFKMDVFDGLDVSSDEVQIIVTSPPLPPPPPPTGVEELETEGITFYPNPVKDKLYFHVPELERGLKITLSDPTGRVVFKKVLSANLATNEFDLTSLSGGLYLIMIQTSKRTIAKPLYKR